MPLQSEDRKVPEGLPVQETSPGYRMSAPAVDSFRAQIWQYYLDHGRQFSWRSTITPYRVFISEIMLQQTQTGRVEEKFAAFVSRFGSFNDLAAAQLSEVLRCWKGLGYNRRAKYLHDAARRVVDEFDSVLPDDPATLVQLPGIGPATAASISVFAFNRPHPFVETNIRTVFIHFFFGDQPKVTDRQILDLVEQTMDIEEPRQWFYALMDYGVMLKKTVGNLSRRSSHYQKQARFEGSNRQLRGRILELLIEQGRVRTDKVAELLEQHGERIAPLIDALTSEGLIIKDRDDRYLKLA